jgi:hypothetical protein
MLDHMYGRLISFDPVSRTFENICTDNYLAYKYWYPVEVCNDTAYMMREELYRFDLESKSWINTGVASPISGNDYYGILFSINGRLYYGLTSPYTYEGYLNRSLWEFDNNLKTWNQKSSLPAITTKFATAYFSMNNKGYVLFTDNQFCEYDPVTDAWTQLQNYPADMNYYGRSAMAIGDKAYVGLGRYSTTYSDKMHLYDRIRIPGHYSAEFPMEEEAIRILS